MAIKEDYMKKAVIYARFRGDADKSTQSIETQIKRCTEYAKGKGYSIVNTYVDLALNGAADTREARQQMFADAERGEWDTIIITTGDRLTRETVAFYEMRKRVHILTIGMDEETENNLIAGLLLGHSHYFAGKDKKEDNKRWKRR